MVQESLDTLRRWCYCIGQCLGYLDTPIHNKDANSNTYPHYDGRNSNETTDSNSADIGAYHANAHRRVLSVSRAWREDLHTIKRRIYIKLKRHSLRAAF